MSADRGPDPANAYKPRAIVLDSAAYVLRQLAPNGPWMIVDRSGPSRLTEKNGSRTARPLVDDRDPMEAMEESAQTREAYVSRVADRAAAEHERAVAAAFAAVCPPLWPDLPPAPEYHVLFVAVPRSELAAHGIGKG